MFIRRLSILLILLFAAVASNAGTQRALLIGVSDYQSNLPMLPGSRNDVQLIRELLVQKYGFDRANIRTMIDEEATRAGIIAALRSLSETAAPDDIVFIHYSGHGSQAPDTNDDEEDGQDETILPYDSRMPGIADITDDELNALIGAIESESIVVILDSCHSGTGTRSGPSQVAQRWVTPDTRRELYETVATRQIVTLPISENHVFFAAAQDFESELDGPFGPDNMRLGLFTAAMVGVLAQSPSTVTPREAINGVNARVEALKASAAGMPIPEPNMEAPLEKQEQPMFVFADSSAQQFAAEPEAAAVQFTSGGQPGFEPVNAVFATMDGAAQPALAESIAELMGGDVGVAVSIDEADAVIDAVGQGIFDVYGPAGVVQVAAGMSHAEAAKIALNAQSLADLVSLDNSASDLKIRMGAAGVPDVRSRSVSTRTVKVSVNTRNHELEYYQDGARRTRTNSLQLEVIANQDCYLTLVSLNSRGDVYLLLPNAGQELSGFLSQGRLSANESKLIPDSLADSNKAGFHYDYSPPGGTDRVIAICFKDLAHAETLRAQIAKLELGGTLDAGLFRIGTRGATNITPSLAPNQPAPSPARPWATAKLSLTVGAEQSAIYKP